MKCHPLDDTSRRRRRRAAVDPLTLGLIAALALGGSLLAGWKPLDLFRPKPPTEQLTKLQAELAAANAAADAARKDKETAIAAERAKLEVQIRSAQQDNLGAQTALGRVAAEYQVPEVRLATNMVKRVDMKLVLAVGKLPPEQQDYMVKIIDEALSGKQAEVDAAMAKLAQRDREFQIVTAEREALKVEVKVTAAKVVAAEKQTVQVQAAVTEKTEEVKVIATKLDAKAREAGSFSASAQRLTKIIIGLVVVWLFLAYVLPGLLKHLDGGWLKNTLRNVAGYATSPLLFHDAKKKLTSPTDP